MTYRIRPATTGDIPDLMALRTEAEAWLQELGSDQWSDRELGERAIAKWHATINDGRAWTLLGQDGAVVGTVSRGPADADFWRESDELPSALYLYKLITSRAVAGAGLGSLVLDWACRIAALEGRRWVRIDCWRTATGLQRYYEQLGFRHVRTEAPAHRKSGWLGERPSSLILNPDRALVVDPGERPIVPAPATEPSSGGTSTRV
jgi:GNAT superfamily N-acetyltransferase